MDDKIPAIWRCYHMLFTGQYNFVVQPISIFILLFYSSQSTS